MNDGNRPREEPAASRLSERELLFLRNVSDAVITTDLDSRITSWNPAAERLYGCKAYEVLGKRFTDIVPTEYVGQDRDSVVATLQEDGRWAGQVKQYARDGRPLFIESSVTSIRLADDALSGSVAINRDITDLKEAEFALAESERRLLLATRSAGVGIWDWDILSNDLLWDEQMFQMYGITDVPDRYGFEFWRSCLHPDDQGRTDEACLAAVRGEEDYDVEFRVQWPDGTGRWMKGDGVVIRDDDGTPIRMLGTNYDITERKRSEQKVQQSEKRFRSHFQNNPVPIFTWKRHGDDFVLIDWNRAASEIAEGRMDRIAGISAKDLYGAEQSFMVENLDRCYSTRQPLHREFSYSMRTTGERKWIRGTWIHVGPDTVMLHTEDITERKLAEEEHERLSAELLQAQKLESVGRLAGGVAHDFNNLLMGIMNYAELCRDGLPAGHEVRPWIDEIMREVGRSANLTRQLLAFARKQTIAPRVLDLNGAVQGMLKMLQRLIGEDVDLLWQPADGLWNVCMDPGQIDQVLANLCVNARDAIDGVGKVTIETENTTVDADYCASHSEAREGEFVVLAVSDDGRGMSADTFEHMFEPFFSTKQPGEGIGLGLATIYGIAKQNEGFIDVFSEPGKGTTFRIYLPRSEGVEAPKVAAAEAAELLGGTEVILLVEDEKSIRVTSTHFLKDLGYEVLAAETPETALRLVDEHEGGIDLLITDVVLPGMSGQRLAETLRSRYPSLNVLYMSGYTADVIAHRGILDEGVKFLSKPITRDVLARKVRGVLDGE